MNSDIRVSLDFFRHPKTKKLKKRLGAEGVLALQSLWVFAAQSRTDGFLEGMDKEDVELASDWCGDEGVFVDTLLAIGFLDDSNGIYSIHDWAVHNSYVATEEDRKDQSRFSRLAGVNRPAYQELKAKGINAITEEQYKELTRTKRPCVNDSLTTVGRPSDDRQTSVEAIDNAASSPNQTKPNQYKNTVSSVPEEDGECLDKEIIPEQPKEEKPVKNNYPADFNAFFQAFPHKDGVSKKRAYEAWRKARDKPSLQDLLAKIEILKRSDQWLRGIIPHPSTWLNGKCWETVGATPMQGPIVDHTPRPEIFDPATVFGEGFKLEY